MFYLIVKWNYLVETAEVSPTAYQKTAGHEKKHIKIPNKHTLVCGTVSISFSDDAAKCKVNPGCRATDRICAAEFV